MAIPSLKPTSLKMSTNLISRQSAFADLTVRCLSHSSRRHAKAFTPRSERDPCLPGSHQYQTARPAKVCCCCGIPRASWHTCRLMPPNSRALPSRLRHLRRLVVFASGGEKPVRQAGKSPEQPSLVTAAPRKQTAVLRMPQSTSWRGFRSSSAPLSSAVSNVEARMLEALSRIAGALCKRLLRPGCTPGTALKGITFSFSDSQVLMPG